MKVTQARIKELYARAVRHGWTYSTGGFCFRRIKGYDQAIVVGRDGKLRKGR